MRGRKMEMKQRTLVEHPGEAEGGRRPTVDSPGGGAVRALAPGQRWSAARKREVVLRLLRGESLDVLSREIGVESYRLERWRERALGGIDASLRERDGEPIQAELNAAMKRIGELSMENELLRARCRQTVPLAFRRSLR